MLEQYEAQIIGIDKINVINTDYNADNDINIADLVALKKALIGSTEISDEQLKAAKDKGYYPENLFEQGGINPDAIATQTPIILDGTLASKSTVTLKRDANGKYKAEVIIPEGTNEGTIGVTLVQGVFINNEAKFNGFVSSELFNISDGGNNQNKITISSGVKEGNKIIFKINAPKDTALRGDLNLDLKIDDKDVELLSKYNMSSTLYPLTDLQKKAADVYIDGKIDSKDQLLLIEYVEGAVEYNQITLTGTLAESSNYELVKDSNGNYSVVVTIPNGTSEGKIGVTVEKDTFMFDLGSGNEAASSELFNLAIEIANIADELKVIEQKDEKQDDGKIKVTVIVNKELDKDKLPNGWTLSEDGKSITKIMNKGEKEEIELVAKDGAKTKYTVIAGSTLNDDKNKNEQSKDDGTTSNKIIPQTGATTTILVVIAGIAIFGIIAFRKYIKNIKIK